MASHNLGVLGVLGDDYVNTVSENTEKPVTNHVTNSVADYVISAISVASWFDKDARVKREKCKDGKYIHRLNLILSESEMQDIDVIAKEFDAGRSGVLRIALQSFLRNLKEKGVIDG